MKKTFANKQIFLCELEDRMRTEYGCSLQEANKQDIYHILGQLVKDQMNAHAYWSKQEVQKQKQKQIYYFSMEFLMGRMLKTHLYHLGIYDVIQEGLADLGIDLQEIEQQEEDAGLGNGGLGRLAACFLDSMATLGYAGHGNGIRYEYGLFKQKILDEKQVEFADDWMAMGNVWEVCKAKHRVRIQYGGHVEMKQAEDGKVYFHHIPDHTVWAVPYDMEISGYHTKMTNTLRLWSAQPDVEQIPYHEVSSYLGEVRDICMYLYPDDTTQKGRYLRLKQQYFFVCAGLSTIVKTHLTHHETLKDLADHVAIQLNDTHPALAICELMRICIDEHDMDWESAWEITTHVMSYTNHTILQEALEVWPMDMIRTLLPRIAMILEEIHRRFYKEVQAHPTYSHLKDKVAIMQNDHVHMAYLAIVGSHHVNGVASLHTQILCEHVMKNFYALFPGKFSNKTNGITHRQWLFYANPQLTTMLKRYVNGLEEDIATLAQLQEYSNRKDVQDAFLQVKQCRKEILKDYIQKTCGIEVDVHSIFDIQVKRIHGYKRQLLNILHILSLYQRIKADASFRIHPRTFIFAGKAAPSYTFAKAVIHLIQVVAKKVNEDPVVSQMMKVVFLPNYNVSMAHLLMSAADVSKQISTAGKEASGTGNMKFMMNGALTLGTWDGANIEIAQHVQAENIEIFGLRAEEIEAWRQQGTYDVWKLYQEDTMLRNTVNALVDGTLQGDRTLLKQIYDTLMFENDEYMVLADFHALDEAQKRVEQRYQDAFSWARTCLINIAQSAYFSSDRTIQEYAKEIWHAKPVKE